MCCGSWLILPVQLSEQSIWSRKCRVSAQLGTHHCRWPGTGRCRRCCARREIPCPAPPWCRRCRWWGWFPATLPGPCTLNTWTEVHKVSPSYRSEDKAKALLRRDLSVRSVAFASGSLNISKTQCKVVPSLRDSSVLGLAGRGRYRERFESVPLDI